MTIRLSTQNLQFTLFIHNQNTVSFSQRSTQNEDDDDETEREWNMNLRDDEEDVNE
jgi:hypothetical protein